MRSIGKWIFTRCNGKLMSAEIVYCSVDTRFAMLETTDTPLHYTRIHCKKIYQSVEKATKVSDGSNTIRDCSSTESTAVQT